jgi:hypothetical protein
MRPCDTRFARKPDRKIQNDTVQKPIENTIHNTRKPNLPVGQPPIQSVWGSRMSRRYIPTAQKTRPNTKNSPAQPVQRTKNPQPRARMAVEPGIFSDAGVSWDRTEGASVSSHRARNSELGECSRLRILRIDEPARDESRPGRLAQRQQADQVPAPRKASGQDQCAEKCRQLQEEDERPADGAQAHALDSSTPGMPWDVLYRHVPRTILADGGDGLIADPLEGETLRRLEAEIVALHTPIVLRVIRRLDGNDLTRALGLAEGELDRCQRTGGHQDCPGRYHAQAEQDRADQRPQVRKQPEPH